MARCPFATWKPLPENATQPAISPRLVIVHTMVGSLRGTDSFFRNSTGIEAHFGIGGPTDGPELDGAVWQWIDTDTQADANYHANPFAVSIETSDGGNPDNPWSPKQLASLVRLIGWLCDAYNIPRVLTPTWDGKGLGWHAMWGAPSPWTPAVGKTCPGPVRIDQFKNTVLPALTGEDIILDAATKAYFDKQFALLRIGDQAGGDFDSHDYASLEGINRRVAQLVALMTDRPVDVDVAALAGALKAALGPELTKDVADELARRLAS